MKIKIPFYLVLADGKVYVTVEVTCKELKVRGGNIHFVISQIDEYRVLEEKSTPGWEHYFHVAPAYDNSICVYTEDTFHLFYMGLPKEQ